MRSAGKSPLLARGAKSKANLRKGGPGRPKKTAEQKAADRKVKEIANKLLGDPTYVRMLKRRLRSGAIQPGVEAMLWYYAHGKPTEIIETKQITPVRVVHEYANEDK